MKDLKWTVYVYFVVVLFFSFKSTYLSFYVKNYRGKDASI